ncbi:MAG: hypothetical protein Kow00105_11570 [Phycisphaeraceae bacterium]
MKIPSVDNPGLRMAAMTAYRPSGVDFHSRLDAMTAGRDTGFAQELGADRSAELRKASEQLVATTLVQPMFAQMRQDPFRSDLFHGGRTEEIFGQQLDTILAERVVSRADFAIVDAVYRNIAERAVGVTPSGQGVDAHG